MAAISFFKRACTPPMARAYARYPLSPLCIRVVHAVAMSAPERLPCMVGVQYKPPMKGTRVQRGV